MLVFSLPTVPIPTVDASVLSLGRPTSSGPWRLEAFAVSALSMEYRAGRWGATEVPFAPFFCISRSASAIKGSPSIGSF